MFVWMGRSFIWVCLSFLSIYHIHRYIGNIHPQVSDVDLQQVFSNVGPLEGFKLIRKEKVRLLFFRYFHFSWLKTINDLMRKSISWLLLFMIIFLNSFYKWDFIYAVILCFCWLLWSSISSSCYYYSEWKASVSSIRWTCCYIYFISRRVVLTVVLWFAGMVSLWRLIGRMQAVRERTLQVFFDARFLSLCSIFVFYHYFVFNRFPFLSSLVYRSFWYFCWWS